MLSSPRSMTLPSQRWLRVVFLATALVFLGVATYLYALRFFVWIESDASVTALLAARALHAGLPVVSDWYYANGDVWVLAPHLIALLPVAVLGVGPSSLLVAVVAGFALELYAVTQVFARLCGERWVGLFAAMVTLMAWSRAHVGFVYIQLGYGFLSVLFLVAFWAFATLAAHAPARPWRWPGAGLLVALFAVQNPTRGLAFLAAPIVVGAVWPWRRLSARRRLAAIATVLLGWLVADVIYTAVLQRHVTFSQPRGLIVFSLKDWNGVIANVEMLWRGLVLLWGVNGESTWPAAPGALVMLGALALVTRDVLSTRTLTALRFVCVVVSAQLVGVLVPLLCGNLLLDAGSVRYLMPSLLTVYGLAAVLAVRALAEPSRTWRWLATGWLVLVPIAALVATPNARPPAPAVDAWPSVRDLRQVREGLAQRGLTRGFSNVINANILDLQARGALTTCPIYFAHVLIPHRWLTDTSCYTRSALPDRFYVVADRGDARDEAALGATLPPPLERFAAGRTYEVFVYRTAEASFAWFDLPLPDGELLPLPLRLPAPHLALHRREVALDDSELVATGKPGFVVYGPYLKLPRGDYEVTWTGRGVASPGELTFTVDSDFGQDVLARVVMPASEIGKARAQIVRLSFTIDRMRNAVEFPVFSAGGARVALDDVVLARR
jgi:hypothetical protein